MKARLNAKAQGRKEKSKGKRQKAKMKATFGASFLHV
jgi:hypothetical protein